MEYSITFDVFRGDDGFYYRLKFRPPLASQPEELVESARFYKTEQNAFTAGMRRLEVEVPKRRRLAASRRT